MYWLDQVKHAWHPECSSEMNDTISSVAAEINATVLGYEAFKASPETCHGHLSGWCGAGSVARYAPDLHLGPVIISELACRVQLC